MLPDLILPSGPRNGGVFPKRLINLLLPRSRRPAKLSHAYLQVKSPSQPNPTYASGARGRRFKSCRARSAGAAELAAEGADERPAVDLGLVVGAYQDRVLVGRIEGEGADEAGVADQLDALHLDAPRPQAVVVVPQPVSGWKPRAGGPARQLLEAIGVEDQARPQTAHEGGKIRGRGYKAAA